MATAHRRTIATVYAVTTRDQCYPVPSAVIRSCVRRRFGTTRTVLTAYAGFSEQRARRCPQRGIGTRGGAAWA